MHGISSVMIDGPVSWRQAFSPVGRCKTFDASADGYGRGEGCAVAMLSQHPDASEASYAILKSSATNQDGRSSSLTAPNGPSQTALVQSALRNAGESPWQQISQHICSVHFMNFGRQADSQCPSWQKQIFTLLCALNCTADTLCATHLHWRLLAIFRAVSSSNGHICTSPIASGEQYTITVTTCHTRAAANPRCATFNTAYQQSMRSSSKPFQSAHASKPAHLAGVCLAPFCLETDSRAMCVQGWLPTPWRM